MPLNHCLPCLCNNNENLLLGREYLCVLIVVLVREGPWKIRLGPGKVLEKSRNFIIRKAWEPCSLAGCIQKIIPACMLLSKPMMTSAMIYFLYLFIVNPSPTWMTTLVTDTCMCDQDDTYMCHTGEMTRKSRIYGSLVIQLMNGPPHITCLNPYTVWYCHC